MSKGAFSTSSPVTEFERAICIHILSRWCLEEKLKVETLFLAVAIFDIHISKYFVKKRNKNEKRLLLRKTLVSVLYLACKYEEVKVIYLDDLVFKYNKRCSAKAVLAHEAIILKDLKFNLSIVCPFDFFKRVVDVVELSNDECKLNRCDRNLYLRVLSI